MQRTIRNYHIGKTWLWWKLWLAIKPNLKCNKVTAEHDVLMSQKNEYTLALQSGGSAVQEIVDKTNRIEGMKNDLQKQVDELKNRIKGEEELKQSIDAQSEKVKAEAGKLRGDIKNLESSLEQTEEDKMTKDSQIRTLREEIAHQEELLAKMQKEKRNITDGKQKNRRRYPDNGR